jgi:hypothetical protein
MCRGNLLCFWRLPIKIVQLILRNILNLVQAAHLPQKDYGVPCNNSKIILGSMFAKGFSWHANFLKELIVINKQRLVAEGESCPP